jgi:hypothetical protein
MLHPLFHQKMIRRRHQKAVISFVPSQAGLRPTFGGTIMSIPSERAIVRDLQVFSRLSREIWELQSRRAR